MKEQERKDYEESKDLQEPFMPAANTPRASTIGGIFDHRRSASTASGGGSYNPQKYAIYDAKNMSAEEKAVLEELAQQDAISSQRDISPSRCPKLVSLVVNLGKVNLLFCCERKINLLLS